MKNIKDLSVFDLLNYCPACRFCDQEMEAIIFALPFEPQAFPNLTDHTMSFVFNNYTLHINTINNIYSLISSSNIDVSDDIVSIFTQTFIVASCSFCQSYNYLSETLSFKDNKINLSIELESFAIDDLDISLSYLHNNTIIQRWEQCSILGTAYNSNAAEAPFVPIDYFDFKNKDKMLKKINNIILLR